MVAPTAASSPSRGRLAVAAAGLVVFLLLPVAHVSACFVAERAPIGFVLDVLAGVDVGEDNLLAYVPQGAERIVGIMEREVVRYWPSNDDYEPAFGSVTSRYWGQPSADQGFWISGGGRIESPPATSSCPPSRMPSLGDLSYRAVWDTGVSSFILERELSGDQEALLVEHFGPPTRAAPVELPADHPYITLGTDQAAADPPGGSTLPAASGRIGDSTNGVWLWIIGAIAAVLVVAVIFWAAHRRLGSSREP